MRIHILSVDKKFQPASQPLRYPSHNRDYGIEQDFHRYLLTHDELTTRSSVQADWHYLPAYWTRWHFAHNYAKTGLAELGQGLSGCILDEERTFTICQYADGPLVNLGQTTVFLASRRTGEGIDIPLICSPHTMPLSRPPKEHLASFVGRLSTHPIRQEMADCLRGRSDVCVFDGIMKSHSLLARALEKAVPLWPKRETRFFVRTMLESYVALCPRGYGGGSFRFYEAMQLGIVPFQIGDIDVRPFKKFISWDQLSLFASSARQVGDMLDMLCRDELIGMGHRAALFYRENLSYQRWCKFVVRELRELSA